MANDHQHVLKLGVLFTTLVAQVLGTINQVQVGNYFEMLQKNKGGSNYVLKTDDKGSLNNCGPEGSNLVAEWSPKILKTGQTYAINAHATTVTTWTHGILCTTVWLDDIPSPLYKDCKDIVCNDVYGEVKEYIPTFQCPLPNGFTLGTPPGFKFPLDPSVPLPAGKYRVEASLKNQDDLVLLCAKGDVEVAEE